MWSDYFIIIIYYYNFVVIISVSALLSHFDPNLDKHCFINH